MLRMQVKQLMDDHNKVMAILKNQSTEKTQNITTTNTWNLGISTPQIPPIPVVNTRSDGGSGELGHTNSATMQTNKDTHVNNIKAFQGSVDAAMRGLLAYFQSLNINVPLPIYTSAQGNPAAFLDNLHKYLIKKVYLNIKNY